ncbi:DUF2065 domain-containing protein [Porticoccus sp. W117]|uniref:DUF2065 domain-containing protein n=1 Tax=Porticoccus sp. W117 TaxID=3054777 RepID=UPI00259785F5|nr:DUF2065 domain-containing protein [Porticoccus sp. W117]MDM3871567.1 DUF2065 domain-containing protein [Porticoccus sp. W117]
MSFWQSLLQAICLMLVLEGIIPFLAPDRWRNMAKMLAQVDDRSMRIMGLVSMLIGAGLLFLIR